MSLLSTIGKRTKNSSSKGPQYYNEQKARFIADMIGHEDPVVREAACANSNAPSKVLQARLQDETEIDVVKAILMNENLPKTALIKFVKESPIARQLDDDEELIEHAKSLNLVADEG